jgi:excinuclease UvrABC nuclease subunit
VKVVAEAHASYDTGYTPVLKEDIARLIKDLESQMKAAARNLEFERAALLRDRIVELRRNLEESPIPISGLTPSPSNKEAVKSNLAQFYGTSKVISRKH